MSDQNGNSQVNHGPPWAEVPAEALIGELTQQVAALTQEIAAMRIYIRQLHQALALATEQQPEDSVT